MTAVGEQRHLHCGEPTAPPALSATSRSEGRRGEVSRSAMRGAVVQPNESAIVGAAMFSAKETPRQC